MCYNDWIESWCFFKGPDTATKLLLETLGLRVPPGGHSVPMLPCPHRHRAGRVEGCLCKSDVIRWFFFFNLPRIHCWGQLVLGSTFSGMDWTCLHAQEETESPPVPQQPHLTRNCRQVSDLESRRVVLHQNPSLLPAGRLRNRLWFSDPQVGLPQLACG